MDRYKYDQIIIAYGSGKVIVVADDAVFLDMFMNEGDNIQFGENIIKWFKDTS